MKNNFVVLALLCLFVASSCKKDPGKNAFPTYTSLEDFRKQQGYEPTTYLVDAAAGGNFTTTKGTKVTIPPNAFITQNSASVTGMVQVKFMDLYSKADMLMGGRSTEAWGNVVLKSGGEFFIKAEQNGAGLWLAGGGAGIAVQQPAVAAIDTMMAFVWGNDSINNNAGTWGYGNCSVYNSASNYVYSLYQFTTPVDSGTWCNSDNPDYFSGPKTTVTINNTTDSVSSNISVYMVFTDANSMVHVYGGPAQFIYNYAPVGYNATVVALALSKNGVLMASFTPITTTANKVVSVSLDPISNEDFMGKLKALN